MNSRTLAQAKLDVYRVCQAGQTVSLFKASSRDDFGTSLTDGTAYDLKVHPVRFAPFSRDLARHASWVSDCSVIVFGSKRQLDLDSKRIEDIKQYQYFRHNGLDYEISNAELYMSFGTDFLYAMIGGKNT